MINKDQDFWKNQNNQDQKLKKKKLYYKKETATQETIDMFNLLIDHYSNDMNYCIHYTCDDMVDCFEKMLPIITSLKRYYKDSNDELYAYLL